MLYFETPGNNDSTSKLTILVRRSPTIMQHRKAAPTPRYLDRRTEKAPSSLRPHPRPENYSNIPLRSTPPPRRPHQAVFVLRRPSSLSWSTGTGTAIVVDSRCPVREVTNRTVVRTKGLEANAGTSLVVVTVVVFFVLLSNSHSVVEHDPTRATARR